jgi:hypothetical protein
MEKLVEILDKVKIGTLSVELAQQQVLDLFGVSVSLPMVEQPILIGHLNKIFGYNGFNKIEIGTPVYSFKDRYYFEMTPINGGKVVIQKFYKDTLTPCIDFVSNER